MPDVPKCSAGYFAAPDMDLIDLFIGAEGTLGVIIDATLRVAPLPGSTALALVPMADEASGLALVSELREASRQTWASRDPAASTSPRSNISTAAVSTILREDGIDRAQQVTVAEEPRSCCSSSSSCPANATAAPGLRRHRRRDERRRPTLRSADSAGGCGRTAPSTARRSRRPATSAARSNSWRCAKARRPGSTGGSAMPGASSTRASTRRPPT